MPLEGSRWYKNSVIKGKRSKEIIPGLDMGKVLYFLDHYKITNITCVFWYIKHTLTHRHTRSNGDMMWGAKAALKIQLMLADLLLTPSTGLDAPVIFSVQLALRHQDIYFIPLNLGFLSCFPNGGQTHLPNHSKWLWRWNKEWELILKRKWRMT